MGPLVLALVLKFVPWLMLGGGVALFARSSLGRALAQRIREGSATDADVAALAADLEEVRRELGEVHERLDFTERLLAQQRIAPPPPARSDQDSPIPPALTPA